MVVGDAFKLAIYCADIGSVTAGNFGWASIKPYEKNKNCSNGKDIKQLAEAVSNDLNNGWKVALGFECPLFVPIPDDPKKLTSARPGEGNRAWSAGAGAGSLTTGLTESLWILNKVRFLLTSSVKSGVQVFLDWDKFQKASVGLFIWEAFITQEAHTETHHGDAEVAVESFSEGLPNPEQHNAIKMGEVKVRSLIGAALLQSEWTKDLSFLSKLCLVICANKQIDEKSIETPHTLPDPIRSYLPPVTLGCFFCEKKIPISGYRKCPAPDCIKEFTTGSWGGLDAHWKANHKGIKKYADLYRTLCPDHRNWREIKRK